LTAAERPVKGAPERAFQLRFGWAAPVRLAVALIIAAAATLKLVLSVPRQLSVSTDVVGYPVYANYNVERLTTYYYLGVLFFPIATLGLYLGLTWLVRRLGWIERDSSPGPAAAALDAPQEKGPLFVALVRALAVGASLGLEATIIAGATGRYFWMVLAAIALLYVAIVLGLARLARRSTALTTKMARANALAAPLVLLGLWATAASDSVTIASNGSVDHYPWMPWWLALLLAGAAVAWIWLRLSAAQTEATVRAIERRTVLFLAAPVSIFLLLSILPGDPGPPDLFHEGEWLVAARLSSAGFLYWRDLLSTHGLLQDVYTPMVGLRIFQDSRWGFWAGDAVLVSPLAYVTFFVFGAWLFERSWAFLVALIVVILSLQFITLDNRFIFWPLILLLFGVTLQRRGRWMAALVGVSLTAQAILVPESAYCIPAVGLIVILHDLYHRKPRTSLQATFSQTLWLAGGGVALFAVFCLYLLTQHALGDFFFYYLIFVPGHELVGGLNVHLRTYGPLFVFFAVGPPVAFLIAFLYYAAHVIRRQPLTVRDWVIAAATLYAVPYYTKYLDRADLGHGEQAYGAAVPVILYMAYRASMFAEGVIARSTWWRTSGGTLVRQPMAILVLVAALASVMTANAFHTAPPLDQLLAATPDRYRPVVPVPPTMSRLGYAAPTAIDPATLTDMQAVFNAYLGPGDWVFDFSNEPALIYYLLGQTPKVRYYHATMAITERAQKDLISELKAHPPKLVVFNDMTYGLLNWDGIPNQVRHYEVSQYILDHYTPLLSTHTQLIYGLSSAQLSPDVAMSLPLQEPRTTQNIDFAGFACDWGYAPNFLAISPPPNQASVSPVTLTTQPSPNGEVISVGWAGDLTTGHAASQVVLTAAGKVIESVVPSLSRPDVVAAFRQPGFANSGYRFAVAMPDSILSDPNTRQSLRIYGVSSDGVATELGGSPGAAGLPATQITLADGTTIPVKAGVVTGAVDTITPYHQLVVSPPAGTNWADYRWLEIDTTTRFAQDGWDVTDEQTGDPGHQVIFRTLGNSSKTIRVFVGSCAQWHGYAATSLYLGHGLGEDISAVRLIP
jgi:hypothetical protein